MSGFTESAFVTKLADLNSSSQSIQTLSLWLIHHRKHFSIVVKIWYNELLKAENSKKMTLMYLANDVIQNSRKKGPEYGTEFGKCLKKAFEHMSGSDAKMLGGLERLLNIWEERGVYSEVQIAEFKHALVLGKGSPPHKKSKPNKSKKLKSPPPLGRKKTLNEVKIEVDGRIETHVHLSPHTPASDPPEPAELIAAIQELEKNIASADEGVRQRIAQLPKEVAEVSLLSKIESKPEAEKFAVQVNEAVFLLNNYNDRLAIEMEHRKKVSSMLRDFLQVQQDLLAQAEQNLEVYQEKLIKVYNVRQELKSHIQNLPDLTQLPDVTGGLQPLPSAENLFMP